VDYVSITQPPVNDATVNGVDGKETAHAAWFVNLCIIILIKHIFKVYFYQILGEYWYWCILAKSL